MPRQNASNGQNLAYRSVPPLALSLNYVLTVSASDKTSDKLAQNALSSAMLALHDQPWLGRDRFLGFSASSGLENQIENIRITMHPLSLDDVFKLWSGFQTPYRLSVAYEVSVVLIDSKVKSREPLPVLSRGTDKTGKVLDDHGVDATAGPGPALDDILLPVWLKSGSANPIRQPAVRKGETLIFVGQGLSGDTVQVRFARLSGSSRDSFTVTPVADAAGWAVTLADAPAVPGTPATPAIPEIPEIPAIVWRAGFYSACVVLKSNGVTMTSNSLSFGVAPRITLPPPPVYTVPRVGGTATIKVRCEPAIDKNQDVAVIVGSRTIAIVPPADGMNLTVPVEKATAGTFVVRLIVDGVTSIPVDTAAVPPKREFDPKQQVTI
jgi:hypothetical protein